MFCPRGRRLERGWPGRIEGDRVVQLAAQTLQAYFAGGGTAREHAEFALAEVRLRAPVLHPPSVRIFDTPDRFEFANPAAIVGPEARIRAPGEAEVRARVAAVIGAEGEIGGYTLLAEVRAPALPPPKDRDFALGLGPALVTEPVDDFDWRAAVALAGQNTVLYPGDILAAPAHEVLPAHGAVEIVRGPIGPLILDVCPSTSASATSPPSGTSSSGRTAGS